MGICLYETEEATDSVFVVQSLSSVDSSSPMDCKHTKLHPSPKFTRLCHPVGDAIQHLISTYFLLPPLIF